MIPVGTITLSAIIIAARTTHCRPVAIVAITPVIAVSVTIFTAAIAGRTTTAIITIAVVIAGIVFILAAVRTAGTAHVVIAALALRIACLTIILIIATALVTAGRTSFILTELVVIDDAEIMVGVLQEIFCLHAVPVMLRVLGQLLVFIEQLGCVAAGPAVDSVKLVSTTTATATAATTALRAIGITTAAAVSVTISIVVQGSEFPHSWLSAAKTTDAAFRNAYRAHLNAGRGAPSAFTSSDGARAA